MKTTWINKLLFTFCVIAIGAFSLQSCGSEAATTSDAGCIHAECCADCAEKCKEKGATCSMDSTATCCAGHDGEKKENCCAGHAEAGKSCCAKPKEG